MSDDRKIDREAINAAVEAIMEQVCEICHFPYVEPTVEEVLTSQCSKCETCPIEGKVRELAAQVEHQVAVSFAHVIADSISAHFAETEGGNDHA